MARRFLLRSVTESVHHHRASDADKERLAVTPAVRYTMNIKDLSLFLANCLKSVTFVFSLLCWGLLNYDVAAGVFGDPARVPREPPQS